MFPSVAASIMPDEFQKNNKYINKWDMQNIEWRQGKKRAEFSAALQLELSG